MDFYRITENVLYGRDFLVFESSEDVAIKSFILYYFGKDIEYERKNNTFSVEDLEFFIERYYPNANNIVDL